MWTKKLKINEIQSNILMYGEICGKEEIREISNREVIFSDRLLAYAGWHAAVHVPVFTILSTCIMKQIVNFFFKSLKKTDYIVLFFFKQKVFVKEITCFVWDMEAMWPWNTLFLSTKLSPWWISGQFTSAM